MLASHTNCQQQQTSGCQIKYLKFKCKSVNNNKIYQKSKLVVNNGASPEEESWLDSLATAVSAHASSFSIDCDHNKAACASCPLLEGLLTFMFMFLHILKVQERQRHRKCGHPPCGCTGVLQQVSAASFWLFVSRYIYISISDPIPITDLSHLQLASVKSGRTQLDVAPLCFIVLAPVPSAKCNTQLPFPLIRSCPPQPLAGTRCRLSAFSWSQQLIPFPFHNNFCLC